MDRDSYLNHVRSSSDMREEMEAGKWAARPFPRGVYGDTVAGKSFTDEQSALLESAAKSARAGFDDTWQDCWSNLHLWTIINTRPITPDEREMFAEAVRSA